MRFPEFEKKFFKKYAYHLAAAVILLFLFLIWFLFIRNHYEHLRVKAGDCEFSAELALSPSQQYKGLSGRKHLGDDESMLFLFATAADKTFVMRKMNFPLDIIFIHNNRIVNLYHDLPPEGKDPKNSYHSGFPVDAVMEIKAGLSRDCRLGVGSEITW